MTNGNETTTTSAGAKQAPPEKDYFSLLAGLCFWIALAAIGISGWASYTMGDAESTSGILLFTVATAAGFFVGLPVAIKSKRWRGLGVMMVIGGLVAVPSVKRMWGEVVRVANEREAHEEERKQRAEQERERQEQLRRDAPENFGAGAEALTGGDLDEAIRLLGLAVDGGHAEAPELLADAREKKRIRDEEAAAQKREQERLEREAKLRAEANEAYEFVRQQVRAKERDCAVLREADRKIAAVRLSPDGAPDGFDADARKLQEEALMCYFQSGDEPISIAMRIESRNPLQLFVGLKNWSNRVVHANPNGFTLQTKDGRSLSIATKTYGLSGHFDTVALQPGTQTSGDLIFDLYSGEPLWLIYSTRGARTVRGFP